MTFNPFSQEKTDDLIKQFRHEFQELKQKDQIEVDEDDRELGPAELLRIEFFNQMSNAGSGLGEMEKYTNRQLNRYARANGCGFKKYTTKTNGQPGCIVWQCGDHRLCYHCRKARAEELISALRYHHNGLDLDCFLRIENIHEADYDKYSKRAQRAKIKYGKINQPNHRILFFSNGDESFGKDLIDYDWDEESQVNWNEVMEQIPMRRNISGSIWQKPGGEEEEDDGEGEEEIEKEMIPTLNFNTNATEREINSAYHKAAAETQIIVTSVQELQKALFNRTRIWQEKIGKEKCGGWMDFTVWVSENDIEIWNKSIYVFDNHIENNDIESKDKGRPLTPLEWVEREEWLEKWL